MFSKLSIKMRLFLVNFLVLAIFVIFFLANLTKFKDSVLQEKKMKLKHVVEVAHGILDYYYKLSINGTLSEEIAKAQAIKAIKSLRYEQVEYFWINDDTLPYPKMVMHPTVPALDGKVLDDPKFNCAKTMQFGLEKEIIRTDGKKNLFQAFVEVSNKAGFGYVSYDWPKPLPGGGTTKELYPKLSFVKKFEPWKWVIGSGIYIDDVDEEIKAYFKQNLTIFIPLFFLLAMFSYFISLTIVKNLNSIVVLAEQVAKGDLTYEITYKGKNEVGKLCLAINNMVNSLKDVIGTIINNSKNVAQIVDMLNKIADDTAKGATRQATMAQSISASAEEMTKTISEIAANTSDVAKISEEAMEQAIKGKEIVAATVSAIDSVYNSTDELSKLIEKLTSSVNEIGDIVTTIKSIADQTNLLALNAAIEAARAGEAGKGFAVVAEEVKNLAIRTIHATAEISEKITAIQNETLQTSSTMKEASDKVVVANNYIKDVEKALSIIVDNVQRTQNQISMMAKTIDQQALASEEITKNIISSADISREIEELSKNAKKVIEKLTEVTEILNKSVLKFKV